MSSRSVSDLRARAEDERLWIRYRWDANAIHILSLSQRNERYLGKKIDSKYISNKSGQNLYSIYRY